MPVLGLLLSPDARVLLSVPSRALAPQLCGCYLLHAAGPRVPMSCSDKTLFSRVVKGTLFTLLVRSEPHLPLYNHLHLGQLPSLSGPWLLSSCQPPPARPGLLLTPRIPCCQETMLTSFCRTVLFYCTGFP